MPKQRKPARLVLAIEPRKKGKSFGFFHVLAFCPATSKHFLSPAEYRLGTKAEQIPRVHCQHCKEWHDVEQPAKLKPVAAPVVQLLYSASRSGAFDPCLV